MARRNVGPQGTGNTDVVTYQQLLSARLVSVRTVSGTTDTLVAGDEGEAVECSNAAAITVTIPPNSAVPFLEGTIIEVTQIAAGQVTVVAGAGVTINVAATAAKTRAQWSSLVLRKRGADLWLVTGDLA